MHGLPRFVLQVGLLVAAAATAATVHLGPLAIVLVMAAAFGVVVLGEWVANRQRVGRAAAASPGANAATDRRGGSSIGRRHGGLRVRATATPSTAERAAIGPALDSPRVRVGPAPALPASMVPPPAFSGAGGSARPAAAALPARSGTSSPAAAPAPPRRVGPAPGPARPEPVAAEPSPAPAPVEPEPEVLPPPPPEPRRWNVFLLETGARSVAERDPLRGEELFALLLHLRALADLGGELPEELDGFVREELADLVSP